MHPNHALERLSDIELIDLYQKRYDSSAMAILYKRYIGLVYGLCYKYLQNHHDAEDATTDIFCIIMDKLKDNTVTYFKSWLYIISKNHVLAILRKNKHQQTQLVEEWSQSFMENTEVEHLNIDSNTKDEWEDKLKIGLESLKEAQQVCIELFYIQKKSYVEVAQLTGFDMNQVKSHIQNGKRNLKIYLESKGY